jgi:hypothetical protein
VILLNVVRLKGVTEQAVSGLPARG